jgi:hypothetical protein
LVVSQLTGREVEWRPGERPVDVGEAGAELPGQGGELADGRGGHQEQEAADHDDRLDQRDGDGQAAREMASQAIGQRPQQRGDQQGDEDAPHHELNPPQRDEHEEDGDADDDQSPGVSGGDPEPVAHGVVVLGCSSRLHSAGASGRPVGDGSPRLRWSAVGVLARHLITTLHSREPHSQGLSARRSGESVTAQQILV